VCLFYNHIIFASYSPFIQVLVSINHAMVVSSPPNTANDNRLNERTPLLKQHRLEQVPTSVDEEAQCPTSVNKPLIRDTPQNIGGVISILLLGAKTKSLILDSPIRSCKSRIC